jgi:hypothetical protein
MASPATCGWPGRALSRHSHSARTSTGCCWRPEARVFLGDKCIEQHVERVAALRRAIKVAATACAPCAIRCRRATRWRSRTRFRRRSKHREAHPNVLQRHIAHAVPCCPCRLRGAPEWRRMRRSTATALGAAPDLLHWALHAHAVLRPDGFVDRAPAAARALATNEASRDRDFVATPKPAAARADAKDLHALIGTGPSLHVPPDGSVIAAICRHRRVDGAVPRPKGMYASLRRPRDQEPFEPPANCDLSPRTVWGAVDSPAAGRAPVKAQSDGRLAGRSARAASRCALSAQPPSAVRSARAPWPAAFSDRARSP